jgi:hypothetical protein
MENTVPLLQCSCCIHVCWGAHVITTQPLPSNVHCLHSHYLAMAVVYLLISRLLPSNGPTCHSIIFPYSVNFCVVNNLHLVKEFVTCQNSYLSLVQLQVKQQLLFVFFLPETIFTQLLCLFNTFLIVLKINLLVFIV